MIYVARLKTWSGCDLCVTTVRVKLYCAKIVML